MGKYHEGSWNIQLTDTTFVGEFRFGLRFMQIKFKEVDRDNATPFAKENADEFLPSIKDKFPQAQVVKQKSFFGTR